MCDICRYATYYGRYGPEKMYSCSCKDADNVNVLFQGPGDETSVLCAYLRQYMNKCPFYEVVKDE